MRPILEKLRAAGLLMADKLQAALITQLEVVAAEPLPDVPDYSMRLGMQGLGEDWRSWYMLSHRGSSLLTSSQYAAKLVGYDRPQQEVGTVAGSDCRTVACLVQYREIARPLTVGVARRAAPY